MNNKHCCSNPNKMQLIYLASPYSHTDESVVEARFIHAAKAAAWLVKQFPDENVFSPIVHSHVMHKMGGLGGLGGDWEFWKRIDTDYLHRCDQLVILCLPGWDTSTGVKAELELARDMENIHSISYMVPFNLDDYRIQAEAPEKETYGQS